MTCVKPKGALYAFPRLDPKVYKIKDDRQMVLDLLRAEKIMIVHGTGFNWPEPDHFRIVNLPPVEGAGATRSPASARSWTVTASPDRRSSQVADSLRPGSSGPAQYPPDGSVM